MKIAIFGNNHGNRLRKFQLLKIGENMKRALYVVWLIAILYLFSSCTPIPPDVSDPAFESDTAGASTAEGTAVAAEGEEEVIEGETFEEAVTIKGSLERYKIKAGDILSIEGSNAEIKVPQARVDDKGYIKLKFIDRVKVAGMTKWEIEDLLEKLYEPFFVNFKVVVEVINLKYTIGGEIKSTGQKGIISDVRLTEAIKIAGDYTSWAKKTAVTIRRKDKDGKIIIMKFNCEKIDKGEVEDPFILPDDIINVPR